ncbi:Soluble aldose sugar dehydrogenase yliI precursor [Legionella lansingensis]|uniref:Soluble aldose sugar dehydrogenase YliI n=1 Tax=Legionella lansingensis TaxID=45067 RepID=A0A0W0VU68_9GAMM|nr:PQQ-dependent sugar dehydrogenase [Legionella lansingensis]KTD23566.1 Soluble aldose sugar dehydrogenase YliI precursor [Legionella lansingensis]SNV52271.1 Soluble aldose sugar dehydrogenase yliI precursor [Legionella lansingensis]
MSKWRMTIFFLLVLMIFLLIIGWWEFLGKRASALPTSLGQDDEQKQNAPFISILAKKLDVPWGLDFLPDNKLIFTQRAGTIHLIDLKDSSREVKPIARINDVATIGEGGLLGIAVHPQFASQPFVYVYYTYGRQDHYLNKVVRYQFDNNHLSHPMIIIDGIPGAATHDGGRIRFGPDGYLYITTGDAQTPQSAQDLNSLAGKILRVKDDGNIPEDNPFPKSAVYSYGHRNPQGLAWDERGQLWATEHGPTAHDEINLIKAGGNYGWPVITGEERKQGMEMPILESGFSTWAPSGAEIFNETLYFCGLRGRTLYGFNLQTKQLNKYFQGELGRLRAIKLGPNKLFYVATNNRDGRGIPQKDDDLIVVINPEKLNK